MTTGNITDDFRTSVRTPSGTVTGVGSYFNKNWTGGNAPKRSSSTIPTPRVAKRARSDRGEHAYSMSLTSSLSKLVRVVGPVGSPYWSAVGGGLTLVSNPSSGWSANDDNNLILDLRSQVQGSEFDMSIFLGTSHQSLRMIGDTAIQLAKGLRQIKQGNMAGAAQTFTGGGSKRKLRPPARTIDEMSKRTLELRYGWLPLLQDLDDGAKFVAQQLNAPMVQRYRVAKKKKAIITAVTNGPDYQEGYKQVQIIAIIKEKPSLVAQLGLLDPANLAWEMLPWSFVIDWALPIGDYLQARSFASNLSGTFITSTKTFGLQRNYVMKQPGWSCTDASGSFVRRVVFTRTISTSLSVRLPQVKTLEKVASMAHAINGIALLAQQGVKIARSLR